MKNGGTITFDFLLNSCKGIMMSSMQPHNMLKATANKKKIHTWSVNTHIYQTKGAPTGLFSGLNVFLPPRLFLDYCVLISIAASSVGLMWRVEGPCESTGIGIMKNTGVCVKISVWPGDEPEKMKPVSSSLSWPLPVATVSPTACS